MDTHAPAGSGSPCPQRPGPLRKWVRVARIIAATCRTRARFAIGRIDSYSGSTHRRLQAAESVAYINRVFDDFIAYGGIGEDTLRDKRILELGPGDNVGVGLRFLARGARQVVCLDKFYSSHDIEAERAIYLDLRKQLRPDETPLFDAAVQLENGLQFDASKLRYVYGSGAQDAGRVLAGEQFDLILSRGVLQEVYEIDRAFASMDSLLIPGGLMVHKIDLRDYGMFSAAGFNPREFLTIPSLPYHWMAFDSDKPNRRMLDYYRRKMKDLGYVAEFHIAAVVETGPGYHAIQPELAQPRKTLEYAVDYGEAHRNLIREIRPRLAPAFRNLTDEELLAAAVFLTARKPGTPESGASAEPSAKR